MKKDFRQLLLPIDGKPLQIHRMNELQVITSLKEIKDKEMENKSDIQVGLNQQLHFLRYSNDWRIQYFQNKNRNKVKSLSISAMKVLNGKGIFTPHPEIKERLTLNIK